MFKLAALSATAAAATMSEMKDTVELFTVKFKQEEVEALEPKVRAFEQEQRKYEMQMQNSVHPQQFQQEFQALAQTHEFGALAQYMQHLQQTGPTPQIKKFAELYQQQVKKLQLAYMKLENHTEHSLQLHGSRPHERAIVDVNNEEWFAFNKEYYRTREMEYYAMYKIPEFVKLRSLMTELRHTKEMG